MAFYVVFQGRQSGVFDSCTQCSKAVDGLIGKNYERYETYDAAVTAWENYCELHGYGKDYFQSRLLQPERLIHRNEERNSANNVFRTTSNTRPTTQLVNAPMVDENHAFQGLHNTECIQHSVQQQLELMCSYMSIQPAVYVRDYLRVRKGIPYFRYKVSLALSGQEPFQCYGKFSRNEDNAKEDASIVAMRWLVSLTGLKIRDFNYYKVRELEQRIQFVESENIQLSTTNRLLTEELDLLQPERRGH